MTNTNTVNNGLENALGIADANNPQIIFNNASPYLLSLNWVNLANTYKNNGFVQTCIDLPVDDAFRNGGFEIDSNTLDADEILKLKEFMSDKNDIETENAVQTRQNDDVFTHLFSKSSCFIVNIKIP